MQAANTALRRRNFLTNELCSLNDTAGLVCKRNDKITNTCINVLSKNNYNTTATLKLWLHVKLRFAKKISCSYFFTCNHVRNTDEQVLAAKKSTALAKLFFLHVNTCKRILYNFLAAKTFRPPDIFICRAA